MKGLGQRRADRGGTYTMIVLAASILILISASAYVQSTRLGFVRVAEHGRQTSLREAAFAGVRWAAVDAASDDPAQGRVDLIMSGGIRVEVTSQQDGPNLAVTSTARYPQLDDRPCQVRATLEPAGSGYSLTGFEVGTGK